MTGELIFAFAQSEFLQALAHGFPPVFDLVHPRDEIEVLRDAQVRPKTELLCHVTGFAFDRFTLANHIVIEDFAAAVIRAQQPAEHPQERRFAATVGSEKSENLSGPHVKIDMIDHRAIAEAFRHAFYVDDRFAIHDFDSNCKSTG